MHIKYTILAILQYRDERLRLASRNRRLSQVNIVENILLFIELNSHYFVDEICSRIEGGAVDVAPGLSATGKVVRHDLLLLIEDLTDSADIRAEEAGEPVSTVDELSERFGVSNKTISRWKSQGLAPRKFIFDGRKRLGYLKSTVDRFVEDNSERVDRASRFCHLTEAERERIIRIARRLALNGKNATTIVRSIAKRTGRSTETIRYTLKEHDRKHPEGSVLDPLAHFTSK